MSIHQIRSDFHQLIDDVENESLLAKFYELLHQVGGRQSSEDFWDQFTDEQKKELEEV